MIKQRVDSGLPFGSGEVPDSSIELQVILGA